MAWAAAAVAGSATTTMLTSVNGPAGPAVGMARGEAAPPPTVATVIAVSGKFP